MLSSPLLNSLFVMKNLIPNITLIMVKLSENFQCFTVVFLWKVALFLSLGLSFKPRVPLGLCLESALHFCLSEDTGRYFFPTKAMSFTE
ncbi:hypothetical protein HCUR_00065 [Holospora curviuscula]|uniref:Uncharacterized protein n=1 Tax=Holospora curviuscula TaxID=1082868 RepID=A0A2S5RHY2_9PROT|nr:hypothetical protein HCUR_00065 [Holospora curviuscula]